MNISISDILSLVSILVAIQALITAVFLWIIDKDKRKLAENVIVLENHVKYTESLVECIISTIDQNYIKNKFYEGIIIRLCDTSSEVTDDFKKDIRVSLAGLNFYMIKSKSELAMHGKIMRDKLVKNMATSTAMTL
jgi:hypothetical protein